MDIPRVRICEVGPRDGLQNPLALVNRERAGVTDSILHRDLDVTPHAVLSRAVTGQVGRTVVVSLLPVSPGSVKDGLAALNPILDHLSAQVVGGSRHE